MAGSECWSSLLRNPRKQNSLGWLGSNVVSPPELLTIWGLGFATTPATRLDKIRAMTGSARLSESIPEDISKVARRLRNFGRQHFCSHPDRQLSHKVRLDFY